MDRLTKHKLPKLWDHWGKGLPPGEHLAGYFHSAMHDGHVLRHRRERDTYCLTVGCLHAAGFDYEIRSHFGLGTDPCSEDLCVEFLAHHPHHVSWVQGTHEGRLRFWRPAWELSPPANVDFLSDWFFTEHGRFQWIVEVACPLAQVSCFGLIDAEGFAVVDHRERRLVERWGQGVIPRWRGFTTLPLEARTWENPSLPPLHFGQLRPPR